MRRVICATLAGWLLGAAGLRAEVPPPPSPPTRPLPEPPSPPEEAAPPQQMTTQQYSPFTGRPYYYGPPVQDPRQQMPQYYGQPYYGPGYVYGPPNAPPGRAPMMGGFSGNRPPMITSQPELLPMPRPDVPMQPMQPMPPIQPGYDPGPGFNLGHYGPAGSGYGEGDCWNGNDRDRCGACGPGGRSWSSVELLFWWARGQNAPPLITQGVDAASPGRLGDPGTTILFGNGPLGQRMRMGIRTRGGFWVDECQTLGVEGSFFFIANREISFIHNCQVGDVIARPFFNTDPLVNGQDAEIICQPGVSSGNVTVTGLNEMFGADANVRRNICGTDGYRVDLVGGFRYMHLYDDLQITENLTNLDANRGVVGEGFVIRDRFQTRNDFYGGQFGLAGEFRDGQWFIDWRALVALGSNVRTVVISGATTFLDPVPGGNPATQPGGLFAQQSNIGTFRSNQFAVVPEFNINFGFNVTPCLRVWAGYTFMYWNSIMRAGEQIDLNVDANQMPTRAAPGAPGAQPSFITRENDLWIHGLSLGMQWRY
jgi:Putative beta barrel porin-7 (BBP7)